MMPEPLPSRPAWDPSSPIVGAESQLGELCGHLASIRTYPKGAFIYQQGETSTRFYQLLSGRVRMFLGNPEGREHLLAIVEPGGLFGEAACFDGLPYHTTTVTVQPCTVRVFPREAMLEAMRAQPDVTLEILRSITRKQRLFALQLETAMFKKAPARVAFILSRLATYYGSPAGARGTRVTLHLSHEVLANMIGVTRVTVTREIGALIRDGIITRDKRHLVVRHPERLLERGSEGASTAPSESPPGGGLRGRSPRSEAPDAPIEGESRVSGERGL